MTLFFFFFFFQSAIKTGIKIESVSSTPSGKTGGNGWMTMAAIGVGAFVVGALAIR